MRIGREGREGGDGDGEGKGEPGFGGGFIIITMFNGMINPTFASIKFQKETNGSASKGSAGRRHEQQPTSFKEIRELKEGGAGKYMPHTSYKKTL